MFARKKYSDKEFEVIRTGEGKEQKAIILSREKDSNSFAGFTITYEKYFEKNKGWEHLLFSRKEIQDVIIPALKNKEKHFNYATCDCMSEVLRIAYDGEKFYLDIFDNYFYISTRKGLSLDCELTVKDAERLAEAFQHMAVQLEYFDDI